MRRARMRTTASNKRSYPHISCGLNAILTIYGLYERYI